MINGRPRPIIIVQGAQWGSEAKGAVAAFLCKEKKATYVVRTGAVNAGHTVLYLGKTYKMQQLPTSWIHPTTKLVLGAGTFIHPQILADEIAMVNEATGEDIRERLYIDHRCSLHLPLHTEIATKSGDHERFGATGKGCSKALIDKIASRGKGYMLFKEWWNGNLDRGKGVDSSTLNGLQFCDTVDLLHDSYDRGERILLEGTQGSHLDLHLGPYPYGTHKQTQAAQWVVESGLSPNMEFEVALVARTFPIRVAGNSGPMTSETTWANIARSINKRLMNNRMQQLVRSFAIEEFESTWIKAANSQPGMFPKRHDGSVNFDMHKWTPEERVHFASTLSVFPGFVMNNVSLKSHGELLNLFEFTTVTKKLRRVSNWNAEDVKWSARVNRASYVVLTFFNYWFPEVWSQSAVDWSRPEYIDAISKVAVDAGVPVRYITTGPASEHIVNVSFRRQPQANAVGAV